MQRTTIIKDSTPTHIFSTIHTDIDVTTCDDIEVKYMQDKQVIFEKKKSDGEVDTPTKTQIIVELMSEDTNLLNSSIPVYIRPWLVFGDKRIPSANTICAYVEDL